MEFKLSELDRTKRDEIEKNNYYFEDDRPSYEKAFYRHMKCADTLFKAGLFREAYLTYLLAVECLLKDLFTVLRAHYFGPDPNQSQAALLFSKGKNKSGPTINTLLAADRFGHDLASLIKSSKELFPELDKQNPPRFAALANAVDVKLDWVSERYQDPDKRRERWKEKCEAISEAIGEFVLQDLSGIYSKGTT